MNCPICKNGILEGAGEVNLSPIKSKDFHQQFDVSNLETDFKLMLFICSKDDCNFTTFEANSDFLRLLKKDRYYEDVLTI